MLHSADIVCISTIDWDFIWQGHQEIMSAFAGQGNRVLFIENTGVRAPKFQDLPRLHHRFLNWRKGTKGFREVRPNVFVYSPVILPFPYSRVARWINRRLLLRALRRWMSAIGMRRPVIWTFLPTPLALDLIHALDPSLTVYYCIDDLASSSPGARKIAVSETRLFREADLVFVTSEKLRRRASQFAKRVHLFPFGVDFETFERVRLADDQLPEDLRHTPKPVVGYVGGIHRWFDQDLLHAVAERLPAVQFVLVGPAQTDVSVLAGLPNLRFVKAQPHTEVPRYVKGFDIGIISYRLTEYTAHVYPTKLNEYLAMGIPVVATDLPEIRRFNDEHGQIVRVAKNAEEFAAAIEQLLQNHPPRAVEARLEVARKNSWRSRIERMSALMEERLDAQDPHRWERSLRRLYRLAQQRLVGLSGLAIALYLLVFQSPALWWIAQPLRLSQPPRPVDAIVVLGGGVGESGKAGGGYQERVKQAVDLYQQGQAPRIIFCSGFTWSLQEAEVMKDLALAEGISGSAIELQKTAKNTHEAVLFVTQMLRAEQLGSILLVSSPYHMRRALWTWHKSAPDIRIIPAPVDRSQFYAHKRGASLEQIRGIAHEYAAIAAYWWWGWI